MNKCIQKTELPEWMIKGKITFIQEDPFKGTTPNNYRPIMCIPMMWKILTAQTREEIYYSLMSCRLFPEEQKGCRKGTRGTGKLLYVDQHILNESKTSRKNLAMACIDYKKVYDMVPQSCLKMYKIPDEVIKSMEKTIETWRVELTTGGKSFEEVMTQRGIFQGDELSSLLFVIAMVPLNHILQKCTVRYKTQ